MASKVTTGLTGLVVASNPHHTLSALYGKILRALTKMPQDASYRKYTEKVVQNRLKAHKDVATLEKEIACGQVEELIVQAENELILARKMLGWKPWESLVKPAPQKQWNWPPAKIDEPMI
ncbi:PREDICTED: NADH dehydrogenase [ubiquinone] 1 alpha subcomplex subunit 5 isoform X2 [Bactrocera latifrons]|uniref:NADH dehydrogenase [ubiquinone] 1 alpha subcomplex subunit 5 isoform X2 n=1 Tax=Bactrocera latifrons TaxID=174628 RepID=UPI0008DCBAD3|nr:PREDICTED: NADH dehydrogenase [ubiquinone] 1 alpha subcomplex subunit 5 isoform X2 [Bactrocera latifrons]